MESYSINSATTKVAEASFNFHNDYKFDDFYNSLAVHAKSFCAEIIFNHSKYPADIMQKEINVIFDVIEKSCKFLKEQRMEQMAFVKAEIATDFKCFEENYFFEGMDNLIDHLKEISFLSARIDWCRYALSYFKDLNFLDEIFFKR